MGLTRILILVWLLAAPDVAASAICGEYKDTIRKLAGRYGEHLYDTQKAPGIASHELWLNMDTGSFTVLYRMKNVACLIKTGKLGPIGKPKEI